MTQQTAAISSLLPLVLQLQLQLQQLERPGHSTCEVLHTLLSLSNKHLTLPTICSV
jgi:hypothetical protein